MRFLEVPALSIEDIEDPDIVDITEPITASISGTTLTINGQDTDENSTKLIVSGEATITLTGDVTVSTVTTSNIKQPSIHKITIKTNGVGNFTYTPNAGVTASSVSTTTKTGSDLEILLITTSGGETYLDLDLADYVSPAANFSNVLTGFNVSDLTSAYGTTAKLYKPDGTLLTTVNSAATGSGVNFGYTETEPGDVIYELEVTDDIGRKSKYNLTRKWINYAMETTSTPGFQKFALEGNEYTTSVMLPNLSSTSKARIHKTTDHGYMGINFKIQGRDDPSGAWTDIPDNPPTNVESDESAEFLAFGNYKYQRVWVKPTAKATTTVSSSNVVTLTLSNVTEDVTTKTITGMDPFEIDETSNVFVFEETAKIGTIPYTVTVGTETYTNTVTATTKEIGSTPNTDFTAAGPNMKHLIGGTFSSGYMCQASADGKYIAHNKTNDSVLYILKGDPVSGYTDYTTITYSQVSNANLVGSMSYDGKYIIIARVGSNSYTYEIWKNDESTSTFTKLAQSVSRIGGHNTVYKPSFVPRSGNYDFAITGTDNNNNFDIKLYKHTAGTDTWTGQTTINDPTNRPTGDGYRGYYSCQFTRDGKYLMMGAYSTYGGYQMYTIDWDANTAVFSGANWVQNGNIGHSGTVTLDGKYVLIFHNDSNSRKIFKNNDAGDWSSATDVTTDFTFNNDDNDQGHDISFFGDNSEYFVSKMNGGYVRVYSWYANKEITLTYNGKDMLTLAHKGGLTTTSVKLYKDDVLYHTFGASETSVVVGEAGVYQAIADEKYYSLKVTVTTITETLARLYLSYRTCFLLKKDGKVWYWGESTRGANATGNNTTVNVATLHDNLNALPSGIKQISDSSSDPHAMCAITNDGKLYTWGYNGHGQLGRGNTSNYEAHGPWLVSTQSSNTFTSCYSSYYSNFALQDNGYIWSCGHNGQYVLGTGNNSDQSTFYRINLPNVIDFDANHDLALALTSDAKVYIWGNENNGTMGSATGTTGTPTHMTTLDGKNIVKVRTGGYQGYAISSDGKLYAWGYNDNYQIPKGTTGNVTTPTEMTWFSRKNIKVVDVAPGHNQTGHLALDDQGNMYVWGKADNGVTGVFHHHPTTHSWPVLLKTNIASISCGYNECGCIDKFGQVYTWGDAQQGQQNWIHGSNSDTDINYPTSNNLSVGSSVVYDGFDKYLLGKDTTVTSNVTFGSNTVSLGTKSEVFISDPHTYKFKIMESGKTTYTSTVISSTPTRPTGRVYPPKSGTHKSLTTSGSANVDNTWTVDGALYGNGDYKASMNKNVNSSEHIYHAFSGVTGYGHMHTNSGSNTVIIQLHMPQKIKLTKYAMYSRNFTGEYTYAPKTWKVYGSNDNGTNWTELDSQTNETVTAWGSQLDHRDTKREYTVTGNTKYFSSYKLDVTANGGGNYVVISQIEYYGDEEGFLSDDGFGKLTVDVKGDTDATSNITFHSNTYAMGAARDLYIKDEGEYTADIYGSSKAFLGSKTHTVSTVDTVPGFTAAFHHGAFSASDYSSAYSSVGAAATAGFVYSDTPAGEYTWGTLAHVKERENPDFTANSTLHTDYSSTYGWTTNSGWEVSAKDEFSTTYEAWKAFNKNDGGDAWLSGSAPSASTPQWLKIKYPSSQVIKSYVIKARDNPSPRFPTAWKLQGSNNDSDWTDIGTEQTVSLWSIASEKSFDVSSNTTAYQYYRLRITGSRESASLSNSDYVAIGEWFLNTVNGENTTNHDQYTRYTYTPPASTITANVLRVAGGGGGGSTRGAGGGAGGLLYSENVSLSGAKSISVANGGRGCKIGGSGNQSSIQQGFDTTFSGLTTSVGGGRGAFSDPGRAGSGGSGGGGGPAFPTAGTGISGQGYAGGNSNAGDNYNGGGGGGAGGVGATGPGVGGVGLDYSSVFGTTYGVSGWFAGGGGGGQQSGGLAGGQGGGGTYGTNSGHGVKHTGGGGGGSGTSGAAGSGGSGIVIIKKLGATNPPALTFDGYNKLTIENDGNGDTGMKNVTISGGPWNNHTFKPDDNAQKGKFQWDLWSQPTGGSQYVSGGGHSLEYVVGYGWYILNQDGTGFGDVSPTSATAGTYVDVNGVTQNFSTNLASSSGGVLTIAHTGGTMTVNETDFFEGGVFPPKVGSLESVTIKKDGAAFATTTSNTVYIRDTGTYTAEVKGSGAYVTELSTVVSGSVSLTESFSTTSSQSLVTSDGVSFITGYGNSARPTACTNSTLVVGSKSGNGAIYVFEKTNGVWTQVQKMTAASPVSSSEFPVAVAIHGDIITCCTYGPTINDGFVYVFEKTGGSWPSTETVKIDPGYQRLTAIDIYGTTIVATERHETNRGRFYIFEKTGGSWPSNYTSRIDTGTGKFTWGCAIHGDNIAITYNVNNPGASYTRMYEKNSGTNAWDYLEQLESKGEAGSYGNFGERLTIYGNVLAASATADESNKGNVFIYKKSSGSWSFDEKIGNHGITNEHLGKSLKLISETKLLIGSYGHAYIYEYIGGTWTETFKFEGTDNTNFGEYSTLSSDGNTAFISNASYNSNQGVVYVYEKGPVGPNITYDGKNKLTVSGTNYEDTTTVSDPNGSTYNIGTAKTMYVKDAGEYVFKISGTDKYAESNVYVSSVDLAGATTKPISFDGYNKLTLIDAGANAASNVTYFSNTYELGSAKEFYIKDQGTYDLEMSGSNVFALSNTVVTGDITEFPNYVNATSFYYGGGVVDNTGKLYTWGHNGFGDSGRGASDRIPTHLSSISDPVSNVWRGDPGFTMAAKTSTDKWYMWGRNTYSGVLGNTTNTGNVTTPEDVTAKVTTYFGDQTVSANKILKIVMGEHHAAALTAGGKVWSWGGDYTRYSTGNNTNNNTVLVTPVLLTTDGSTQLTGITEIQSTFSGTAALDSSGNVWFWGGASTSMQYARPTKLLDSSSISGIIGMATNGKSIYAWKSDGTFYTRGAGNYGQLANGADNDQYTSWQTVTTLQGKTIKKVFGGNENIFAWTDDGVYGVGRNNNYKLAEGSLSSRRNIWHKSTTLSALSIKEIDFGHATGLVLTTDGKGYMWGEDSSNSMANALSGHQSGAAEATSISALSLSPLLSPSLTFDNYNKLTVSNFTTTDIEWPPASFTSPSVSDGNPASINGITSTNSAKDAEWVISGASYGNGTYKASTTIAVHSTHAVHGPFQMFNKVNGSLDTKTTTTNTSGEWTIELPSSILLYKYNLHHGNAVSTSANYPKDWTIEGSNDGTTWVVIDTRSNETYASSVTGFDVSKREYTVSNNTTKYKHYKLNVSAINSGSYILIGAWRLFEMNTRTATLTDPNGSTYALGQTQDTIYIRDTGDYTLDVRNNDQKAIVGKTIGAGQISEPPVINHVALTSGTSTFFNFSWSSNHTFYPSVITDTSVDISAIEIRRYHAPGENQNYDEPIDSYEKYLSWYSDPLHYYEYTNNGRANISVSHDRGTGGSWDNWGFCIHFTDGSKNYGAGRGITFNKPSQWFNNRSGISSNYTLDPSDEIYAPSSPKYPALTFDTYNKLTVANVDSDATSNIEFFSNTYEMGTRKELIINDTGTYYANIYSSNTLALVKKEIITESGAKKVAFHHGTFSASDYSSAYSTVEAAATAGFVYSDTSTTPTYTWGTLGTISSTSTNTTYTWTPASTGFNKADILMVAGGGGGSKSSHSYAAGAGGGAGGLVYKENQSISGVQTIVVGTGGTSGNGGTDGQNTTALGFTALGGGGGATSGQDGNNGGSGGGGDGSSTTNSSSAPSVSNHLSSWVSSTGDYSVSNYRGSLRNPSHDTSAKTYSYYYYWEYNSGNGNYDSRRDNVLVYNYGDRKWYDGRNDEQPVYVMNGDATTYSGTYPTSSDPNQQTISLWSSSVRLGVFNNPYYDSSWVAPNAGGSATQPSHASGGFGNSGGQGGGAQTGGGGGGGAGSVGQDGNTATGNGGNGGDGKMYSISGSNVYYAGGGGGGTGIGGSVAGTGGQGGGGNGGQGNGGNGGNGSSHTGGGGGGSNKNSTAGEGGSGVVIIKSGGIVTIGPETTLSETSIAKQFIYDTGGYTDAMFSEGSETQSIRLSSDGLAMALGDGNYSSNNGRLYYYERSSISGTFTKTHTFDAVSSGLEFGASVDMNAAKTRIAISGSDADNSAANAGRVYIYDRASTSASWPSSPTATITPPASTIKRFGHTVNMSDDGLTMITSGDGADSTANRSGVYVYEYAITAPSASTISFTSGVFTNNSSYYEKGPTTATTVLYNRRTSSTVSTGYGLLLERQSDGTTKAYCNSPSTENLTPDQLSIDGGPFSDSVILISGKVLEGQYYSGVTAFKFTVDSTHLFSQVPEWSKTFQVTQGISRFGFKVAMNKTGTRFIAGGTNTAYYVYHKESGTWNSTAALTGETGYYCGMSPDGNTVAVGIVQYSSNLGRVAVYKYSGGSWGSVVYVDTTVGSGTYQIGSTPVFNNDGTLLVTGCISYNSYMGCIEMWKYESGSWVFKKQFLNPTVKTGHGGDTGEFFGSYLSMDYAGTSVIVSNTGNDVAGADYGRVVLYGAGSPPSLTFDGYNKLTAPVLEPTFTETRLSDWDNNNQSKTNNFGTGDWPETTAGMTNWWTLQNNDKVYDNLWKTTASGEPLRDPAQLFTTVTSSDWAYGAHTDHKSAGYGSSDSWNVGYKFTAGSKKVGSMKIWQACATHPMGDVTIKYWDGTSLKTVTNQSPSGFPSSISYYTEQEFTFDTVNAQYWMFDAKAHVSSPNNTFIGSAGWQLLSGRDPVSTVLTKGSDSYDIGTASSIYIDAAGTYDAQAKNSNTFVIKTSNVVSGSITRSQVWKADGTEDQILYGSDPGADDNFGHAVAVDGNYAVVGSRYNDTGGTDRGAAFIFHKSGGTWTEQAMVQPSDTANDDWFGRGVAISGDYVIVNAYAKTTNNTGQGAAYIFYRSGTSWAQQAKLNASDSEASDAYSYSVDIDGDYAIVGSLNEDPGGTSNAGSAYIYVRSGTSWSQQAKIQASDKEASDTFGRGVTISGDYAAVGADNEDTSGSNAGSVYIFKYDATYPPDDLPPVDSVGTGFNYKRYTALDTSTHYVYKMWRNSAGDWRTPSPASANTIKVLKTDSTDWSDNDTTDTNPTYIDTTTYSGKVSLGQSGPTENYRFSVPTFGRWSEQQKIQSSDIQADDYFGGGAGQGVSLSGDYLAVGARKEDTGGSEAGSVYIFKRGTTSLNTVGHAIPDEHTSYYGASDWICQSVSGTVGIYKHIYRTGTPVDSGLNTLQYDSSTSTWSDHGTGQPEKFTKNDTNWSNRSSTVTNVQAGDVIRGWKDNTNAQRGQFTQPSSGNIDIWSQEAKLQASDVSAAAQFGMSVSLSGDVLAVGANAEDTSASDAGAAYIFERSGTTWTEVKKITASDTQASDYFGESISTDGTTTFVGAFGEDTKGSNAGAAYVYEKQYVGPTLTYDNSNKLSLTGVTTPSSNLTVGTNTYDIGSAKDVYIKDQGTYTFHTNDGDQALILNKTVSSTPSGTTYNYTTGTAYTITTDSLFFNYEAWNYSGSGNWLNQVNTANNPGVIPSSITYNSTSPKSFVFNNSNTERINIGNVDMQQDWTLECWAKFSDLSANRGLFGHGVHSTQEGLHINVGNNGSYTRLGFYSNDLDATFSFQVDTWYHLVYVYDRTNSHNKKIYINGVKEADANQSSYNRGTDEFSIGNTYSNGVSGNQMQGEIAVARMYTKCLSAQEIGVNYAAGYLGSSTTTTLSGTLPSQVYDNTKTITVSNIPSGTSTVGKIYKGATAYTIHATEPTSNVIIKNTGSYVSVFTTSSAAYLTNTVNVNATPTTTSEDTTIEDEAPIVTTSTTTVQEQEPETFSYTGAIQTYTVPDGITSIKVKCWGGAGGAGSNGDGGAGGYVEANVSVTPGEVLNVAVGQGGKSKGPPQSVNGAGGGLSGIFSTWDSSSRDNTHTAAILVAGAGGGGGNAALDGGCGGGETGGSIISSHRPGTQTAGGAWPGKNGGSNGQAGTKLSGGRGGGGSQTAGHSGWPQEVWGNKYGVAGGGDGQNAAGGGGGYYGASGGTDLNGNGGSAAGGSGYTGGDGTHTITEALNLIASQNGSSINPPKTDDEHYQTGIGVALTTSASTNQRSGNGLVVIIATKEVTTTTTGGIPGSTAVPSASSTTTDAPSTVLVATTEVAAPTMNLDFTANMSTFPRNLKRYNNITSSSIGARFNRTHSRKKRVHKSINTDTFSIELTANNMGDSSSSSSTLPVTVVNSGAGTQYESGWTTAGSTSSFVVPSDAPNALYYYSQNDDSAGGSISVSSASTTTHTVTVVSSSAGTQYTSGWTASGTPGSSGGINTFIAPSNAPSTLYYYCGNHSGMGGAINMVSGPVSTTFTVTVQSVSGYYGSSSNYYFIDGTQQATISLVRGKTYTFNNNASANHPMYITTSSDGTTYTSGVTNGGTSSVTFAVPLNAPSTLYYKCGNHGGMGGTIHILGPTASPLAVTVAGGKFVIGGVSQATLQLVRGETYVFNQENSSNGTHPLRLSTTSNGTHVSGGSGFYIGGTQRPTLSMVRGNTYTFDQTNASNGSHVLQIATASDGTQYTSGYTTGTFVVPLSAPSTLYYKSSTTAGMGGLINVTGSSTSAFNVTFSGGKFSIGGVEQASLSVIRGLTYTFNQISGHVLSLSSTSDGTRNTGVNKYYISGVETPTLTFIRGSTYTFTQATSTNTGHPIRLSATSNGTHASGSQYTSGWTTTGTPGSSGASSQFIVPANAPSTLYYYCQHHSGMGGTGSINVADSNSGIILTYGTHALVANSTVSGEYTIATNFDGTTSNLYVNGDLITQTTPTIASGAKMLKIGEDYNGLIKNLKFWNYAKEFLVTVIVFHHDTFANSGNPYSDGSVTAAATAGHIYSDTTTGTYTWGTLGSASTASNQTTYTWTPTSDITADVLMVAGGGGGGGHNGGGGGGGGLLYYTNQSLSGQKTIIIGNGGSGGVDRQGYNGTSTTFTGLTSVVGGGGGGAQTVTGQNGGSGGGGGYANNAYTPGSGTAGQGFGGGIGNNAILFGGGGGAGAIGEGATSTKAGDGGVGKQISIGGNNYYWAGGGGGSSSTTNGTAGNGGLGGGGGGGTRGSSNNGTGGGTALNTGEDGVALGKGGDAGKHTGGGGGAANNHTSTSPGGSGGSGIVIIRYAS